jgi:UDP-N-acetylmuramyl pentapeptide phosphotransferase/UDP-N-acetylglucosamine-1-phosphate transferase
LNLLFDQGWIGLTLFGLLTFLGLLASLRQARHGNRLALAVLAGLLGFLLVGLFDSLLDVPRLALLYFLVLFSALLKPDPSMPSASHSRVQTAT